MGIPVRRRLRAERLSGDALRIAPQRYRYSHRLALEQHLGASGPGRLTSACPVQRTALVTNPVCRSGVDR